MSKNKVIRMTMGGILLATAVAAGVSLYKNEKTMPDPQMTTAESTNGIEKKILEMPQTSTTEETEKDVQKNDTTGSTDPQTVETSGSAVDMTQEKKNSTKESVGKDTTTMDTQEKTPAVSAAVPQFSVNSTVVWPVNGAIVMDYSMDRTVYFPTLNVYKCNPAVLLRAKIGDPVKAACAGTVKECFTGAETGDTVTVNLGNGYEAVYGQLQDVIVKAGDKIVAGETIATVAAPTRYYKQEGTHLYFAMTKDGKPVDPADYAARTAE